jgi:SAM-dependent methyltransferase
MRSSTVLLPGLLLLALSSGCSREARPPEDRTQATAASAAASAAAAQTVSASPAVPSAPASASPAAAVVAATEAGDSSEKVPDIEYVPTPQNVVDKMLEVAKVTKGDVLYDLGCGDGRIVVTAAKKFGVKAIGFDVDPQRIAESTANAKAAGVEHLVSFEKRDIFTVDLSPASVVTLYLLPELNVRLIPQLEKLKPGARVVSHDFDMEGVQWEKWWTVMAKDHRTPKDREHYVYLWKTPLKKK